MSVTSRQQGMLSQQLSQSDKAYRNNCKEVSDRKSQRERQE